MTPKTTDDFGGIKQNAEPIEDPQTELSAEEYNRLAEAVAQMTNTTIKVIARFLTTAAAAPQTFAGLAGRSHAGLSSGLLPTVTKTADGFYNVVWPANFTNPLGVVETLSINFAWAKVQGGTTHGLAFCFESGSNSVAVEVVDFTDTPSDLGGGVAIEIWGM